MSRARETAPFTEIMVPTGEPKRAELGDSKAGIPRWSKLRS